MTEFLTQAKHNEEFLANLCSQYPDLYYDWKITVCFYIALHYLKALATSKCVDVPPSHYETEQEFNPRKGNKLNLTYRAWDWYFELYLVSRTARYDGYV